MDVVDDRIPRTISPLAAAVQALHVLQPADSATRLAILQCLGYIAAAPAEPTLPAQPLPDRDFESEEEDDKADERRGLHIVSSTDQLPPLLPSMIELTDQTGAAPPAWIEEVPPIPLPYAVSDPFSEPLQPLLAPNYSRAILSHIAAKRLPVGEIDLDELIRQSAKCRPFFWVPRLLLPSLSRGIQLLVDTHEGMQPFRLDVRDLIADLHRTVGRDRVEILRFQNCPLWGVQPHPGQADKPYQAPAFGRPVLVISDLGIGAVAESGAHASMAAWQDFALRLKRRKASATVLIPYAPKHWPKDVPVSLRLVVWDRTTTATTLDRGHRTRRKSDLSPQRLAFANPRLSSTGSDALRLGVLASPAIRIEPQLLRLLRLQLAPNLDAGAEARFWLSDLIEDRAATGIVMNARVRSLLQRRLAQMPELFEAAYGIIRQAHRRSAETLKIEEELVYHSLRGNVSQVRKLLRSLVATLIAPGREGIANWAGQALLRISPEIKELEETKMLAAGTAVRIGETVALHTFENGTGTGLDWLLPRRRETEIGVNLRKGAIEFGPVAMRATHKIRVPDSTTVIIEISWIDENEKRKVHYVRIQPGQRAIFEIGSDRLELNIVGGQQYRLFAEAETRRQSSQKFVARNRAPRVRIEYDIEIYGAEKKVEPPFIIGVMADLTGPSSGADPPLSDRRFLGIDIDNFEKRMAAYQPRLGFQVPNRIDGDGELSVDLTFLSMNHFHPESVATQIPALNALLGQRHLVELLASAAAADHGVAQAIFDLGKASSFPVEKSTFDFSSEGTDNHLAAASKTVDESFLKSESDRLKDPVGPPSGVLSYWFGRFPLTLSNDAVSSLNSILSEIDNTLSIQLREILHHPQFQALESAWRGLYYLVANTETDDLLKIRCISISEKELCRTLKKFSGDRWMQSPFFLLINEHEYAQFGGEPYGCVIGDYYFDHDPQDVACLSELAKIGAASHTQFIFSAAPTLFGVERWKELTDFKDVTNLFKTHQYAAWHSLRESEDSLYLALAMPRVRARLPYGQRTSPVKAFEFEELNETDYLDSHLWMNAAYVMGVNIGRSFKLYGWLARIRGVESGGIAEALPAWSQRNEFGEKMTGETTDCLISDRREFEMAKLGLLPLVNKGKNITAFFSAQPLKKPHVYDNSDATANAALATQLPYTLNISRFAQVVKCMLRDKIGSFLDRDSLERWVNLWLVQYVIIDPNAGEVIKAIRPLAAAEFRTTDVEDYPGYVGELYLKPHYQLEGLTVSLRTILRLPSLRSVSS